MSVSVRLPNGHLQNIKINGNTIIIQILDEICEKWELDSEEYDLTFHNKALDPSSTFRFSGVPYNAFLGMTKCAKPRLMSDVTVRLHVEDQENKVGVFTPNTSLLEILEKLASDKLNNLDKTIILYAQKTFSGETNLKATTLRKLGLFKGQVTLRLRICDPDQLNQQAHIYVPKTRVQNTEPQCSNADASALRTANGDINTQVLSQDSHNENSSRFLEASIPECSFSLDIKSNKEKVQEVDKEKEENVSSNKVCSKQKNIVSCKEKKVKIEKDDEEKEKDDWEMQEQAKEEKMEVDSKNESEQKERKINEKIEEQRFRRKIYLGERKALIYNKADIKTVVREDTPDSFYIPTIDDIKKLYKQQLKFIENLQNMPLMTSKLRNNQLAAFTSELLNIYPDSIIRICFPNQLVLQGVFSSTETVQSVYDFVRNYLRNPEAQFVLYESPPRRDLTKEKKLYEENLVPLANVYYSGSSTIKDEIKLLLSDYDSAEADVSEIRKNAKSSSDFTINTPEIFSDNPSVNINNAEPTPGPSHLDSKIQTNSINVQSGTSYRQVKTDSDRIPNWFAKGLKKL